MQLIAHCEHGQEQLKSRKAIEKLLVVKQHEAEDA